MKIFIFCMVGFIVMFAAGYALANSQGQPEFSTLTVKIPEDFKLLAIAGGASPRAKVNKIEINAKGECTYWEMYAKDSQDGRYRKVKEFIIDRSFLKFLYRAVEKSGFFELKEEYKAANVFDGSYAVLTITANKKTHRVRTQNMAVEGFDKIMIAVNIVTPKENKVLYNEILD